MAMTDMGIIGRSMTSRLFSTAMTVATVATAVALLLVLISMEGAARRAFDRGTGNMDLLVSRDSDPLMAVLNGVFYAGAPDQPIEWAQYKAVDRLPNVEFAIPTQLGDSYRGRAILATTQDFFTTFEPYSGEPWRFASGRPFSTPTETERLEVVAGADAAASLGLSTGDALGAITHGVSEGGHEHDEYDFVVSGVLEPSGSAHDRALFMHLESSWLMHAHDRRLADDSRAVTTLGDVRVEDRLITGIYVKTASRPGFGISASLPELQNQLRTMLRATVDNPKSQVDRLFAIVGNIDDILLGMAGVVMLSSGIAIMLALYNSMDQRRRQIAVLRVLGCSRMRVFGLVLTESALIGMIGSVFGVLICMVAMQGVTGIMRERLGVVIEPSLSAQSVLLVVIGAVGLAAAAGLIPAVMGYRTSVVRNLRPLG